MKGPRVNWKQWICAKIFAEQSYYNQQTRSHTNAWNFVFGKKKHSPKQCDFTKQKLKLSVYMLGGDVESSAAAEQRGTNLSWECISSERYQRHVLKMLPGQFINQIIFEWECVSSDRHVPKMLPDQFFMFSQAIFEWEHICLFHKANMCSRRHWVTNATPYQPCLKPKDHKHPSTYRYCLPNTLFQNPEALHSFRDP